MDLQRSALLQFLANEGITPEVMLETAEARFAPLWYPQYFRTADPTVSLEFETILSAETLEAMATVGSRESEVPLHGRQGLEKLKGEVPPIFVGRKFNAQELRNLEILLGSNALSLPQRLRQVMAREIEDYAYCRNSVQRRLDFMCKQAVSYGTITINIDNNPKGIFFDVPLVGADNKVNSVGDWSNPDTDIIQDFEKMRLKALALGVSFERVMISEALWYKIIKNKSLRDFLKGYFNPGSNARFATNLENINAAFTAERFPIIDIVSDLAYIDADGKKQVVPLEGWSQTNAIFVPAGDFGIIHNSLADEQITPVENVDYLTTENILLSRWRTRKPSAEITEAVYNAFPGFEQAKKVVILNTLGA